jgi:hypothetical protein
MLNLINCELSTSADGGIGWSVTRDSLHHQRPKTLIILVGLTHGELDKVDDFTPTRLRCGDNGGRIFHHYDVSRHS